MSLTNGAGGFTMKRKRGRLALGLAVALVVLILDQAVKLYMVAVVMDPPRVIPLAPFFDLVMVWNRGVSFGLMGSGIVGPLALSALALIIAGLLVNWLRTAETRLLGVALGLVIGGAIGNAIDRLHWGAVADFFSVSLPLIPFALFNPWPAFNLADMGISIGVLLVLLDGLAPSHKVLT
jgi:signal peptidase II